MAMKKSVIFAAMACMVHSVVAVGLGEGSEIALGGEYQGHLQDVWWDGGTNLWWAHTHQILRTDLVGRVLASVDVEGHNADEKDFDDYHSPSRRTFNGWVQAIVRAHPGSAGNMRVRVSSVGLAPSIIEVGVKGEAGEMP